MFIKHVQIFNPFATGYILLYGGKYEHATIKIVYVIPRKHFFKIS